MTKRWPQPEPNRPLEAKARLVIHLSIFLTVSMALLALFGAHADPANPAPPRPAVGGLSSPQEPPLAEQFLCDARDPDLAPLPGGGFVSVWTADEIAARLFGPDRRPLGPDFRVNLATEGAQDGARVAARPDGGFVVTWADSFEPRIVARLFDAAGDPTGEELDLAAFPAGFLPNLALADADDDTFWVFWETLERGIEGGRFDAAGRRLARVLVEGSPNFRLEQQPAAVVDAAGNLVLAWNEVLDELGDLSIQMRVLARRFDPSGRPLGDVIPVVASGPSPELTMFGPSVAATPAGGFVVAWILSGEVFVRRFDAGGEPLAPPLEIAEAGVPRRTSLSSGVDVSVLSDGRFAVVWDSLSSTQRFPPVGTPGEIFLGLFTPEGMPAAPPRRVNLTSGLAQRAPRAVVLASGALAVAWWTELPPPSMLPPGLGCFRSDGVFARVLTVSCPTGTGELCLGEDQRFRVDVIWQDPFNGGSGVGKAVPLTRDTGAFWFFDPDNLELSVKVIDGRRVNGHFWFFYGALTNVGYQITVTDRLEGRSRVYENPPGQFGSFGDPRAFPGALP